jgi:hypothetical protein
MAHPLVVHCKHAKFDVYIGRPSKWGNPWRVGMHGTRAQVIAKYEDAVRRQPGLVASIKKELRGKVLGCWCAPEDCHGDVLARIANEDDDDVVQTQGK